MATLQAEDAGSRAPGKPEPDLTVAICTRDRRESLLRAIASLAEAADAPSRSARPAGLPEAPGDPSPEASPDAAPGWELLVVDNASRDDTRSACESLADTLPVPMRVVGEPTPGLSHARNRALAEARARVVVFIDDDVRCHPGFAAAHRRAFARGDVVATGGRILPVLPPDLRGRWRRRLEREIGGPTGRYDFGPAQQEIPGPARILLPFGGNFGVLRDEALAAGGFPSELGFGAGLVPGEETALLSRLAQHGGCMLYVPDATVDHYVDARRASFAYFRRWQRGYGRALVRASASGSPARDPGRVLDTTARALLRAVRDRDGVRLVKTAECGIGQLLEIREIARRAADTDGPRQLEAREADRDGPWQIEARGGDTATPLNLRKRLDRIEALLPPLAGLRILDAGCGGGEYVRALAQRGADAIGIEYTAEKLACVRAERSPVARRIGRGDIERAPFADARFDAVLLNEVLEHVPDDAAALREMHRVLRPGGSLVVFSPNRLYPFETHGVLARRSGRRISHATPFVPWIPLPLGRRLFRYWARNYWPAELRGLIRAGGFRIERRGFVWQTFENISGHQPAWMAGLRPLLRGAAAVAERTPVLRGLGVSQWILATRVG